MSEWRCERDSEAGPGWDWFVVMGGKENITNLDEDTARRIVADHNEAIALRASIAELKAALREAIGHLGMAGCPGPADRLGKVLAQAMRRDPRDSGLA